eukprot:5763884-Pleurochrysis_carterae.AAC.2
MSQLALAASPSSSRPTRSTCGSTASSASCSPAWAISSSQRTVWPTPPPDLDKLEASGLNRPDKMPNAPRIVSSSARESNSPVLRDI